jgi:hypothetical protein
MSPGFLFVSLPTGELRVVPHHDSSLQIAGLLAFGARDNSRRGFLLVSRVLGKHIPSIPQQMQHVHEQLASLVAKCSQSVPGDAVVIGMAETATGLGLGIFDQLRSRYEPQAWRYYFQTTRYARKTNHFDGFVKSHAGIGFKELHSHAVDIRLEVPECPVARRRLLEAETVLLIDDEITTGQTFLNLIEALQSHNSRLRNVLVATICDFSDGVAQQLLSTNTRGIDSVQVVSLVSGRIEFDSRIKRDTVSLSSAPLTFYDGEWSRFSARQGICRAEVIPESILFAAAVLAGLGKCLVLGTTEFMDPAFRLAIQLQQFGLDCRVQSTTRSPLLVAGDITAKRAVPDLYSPNTPSYLYNYSREDYESIIVVHETSDHSLARQLCLNLADGRDCIEVDLLRLRVIRHSENRT